MQNHIKNGLIRLFFDSSTQETPPPKTLHNILLVSTTGLGDTLWATPAIRALKKAHPQAKLFALTSPLGKEILNDHPDIEKCFVFKKPYLLSFFRCRSLLKKRAWDAIVVFHASQRLIFPLCASLKTNHLIGTEKINKGLDFLFTKTFSQKPIHEAMRRLELVSFLGASMEASSLEFPPFKKEKSSQDSTPLSILLHPGAQDRYKCWPISCFIEVAKQLTQKEKCKVFLSGTAQEQDLLKTIIKEVPSVQIIQTSSLKDLAKQMTKMDLLITNDTGPMHLATAIDLPVVAVFAPTDPKICGPFFAKKATVLSGRRTCTPCLKRKCRMPFCLLQTSPDQVLYASKQLLGLL